MAVGHALGRGGMHVLQALHGDRPVPLGHVLRLRRAARAPDTLVPDYRRLSSSASEIANPELARLLADVEFDPWTMTPRTLDLLERLVRRRRPTAVLELGSGVSTVALALALREWDGRVYSIDESDAYLERTRALLAPGDLGGRVASIARPLVEQEVAGRQTRCYDLPAPVLDELLGDARPELLLVDGPSGGGDVRFGTLPLVASHVAPGATFLLDDARRDDELRVAAAWSRLPGVRIDGVYATEKGVLAGTLG